MNIFTQLVDFIGRLLRWWVVVQPWEQALRVRLGKRTRLLFPGVHFCVPYIDAVYLQNIRRRAMGCMSQTVSTTDDVLITFAGTLRYSIKDVLLLQTTLHDATDTVRYEAQNLAAHYIATRKYADITPVSLASYVTAQLNFGRYGLGDVEFALQDFAAPRRVLRVINDSLGCGQYSSGGLCTTQPSVTPTASPR